MQKISLKSPIESNITIKKQCPEFKPKIQEMYNEDKEKLKGFFLHLGFTG